ncbi:MAG: DUF3786 domain-containing protein [Bacillota bacterium]|nr:DUF3786 domain-containing protein [Bacillota bacterium]
MSQKRSYFNLDVTFAEAVKQFKTCDPGATAARAAVAYDSGESKFRLPFINHNYSVQYPSGRVTMETGEEVSKYLAIILLHYLVTANGTLLTGQWIAFRHLPGGQIYIDPFNGRAVKPFLKAFGEKPEDFQQAAKSLGGYQLPLSGISIAIPVLPRVPICFILWPGDEEMPASANILFDEAASSYLPTEDYAHLPAMVITAMQDQIG